jgi:hypothetical protein
LTGKEEGVADPFTVVMIRAVYAIFAGKRKNCPGPCGLRTVK